MLTYNEKMSRRSLAVRMSFSLTCVSGKCPASWASPHCTTICSRRASPMTTVTGLPRLIIPPAFSRSW